MISRRDADGGVWVEDVGVAPRGAFFVGGADGGEGGGVGDAFGFEVGFCCA